MNKEISKLLFNIQYLNTPLNEAFLVQSLIVLVDNKFQNKTYKISFNDLHNLYKFNKNNLYKNMNRIIHDILSKKDNNIHLYYFKADKIQCFVLDDISKNIENGDSKIIFDENFIAYMKKQNFSVDDLKRFIDIYLSLKNKRYAFKLYNFFNYQKGSKIKYDIYGLKKILFDSDIIDNSNKLSMATADFNRRILKPCIELINSKTDLFIDYSISKNNLDCMNYCFFIK